jgi:outer membrane cobalamin receptor
MGLRAETEFQLGKNWDLITGNLFEIGTLNEYDILIPGFIRQDDNGIPQALEVDTYFRTIKNGTYATASTQLGKWRLTAGARADYFSMTKDKMHFSPRLAAFYYINENMSITGSIGRYYQTPQPIWLIGDENQELDALRADQMVIGWNHTPMEEVKVQVEAFYKFYSNYPARTWRPQAVLAPAGFDNVYADIPYGLEPISPTGEGVSRGVELFIQKKLSEIPIWGLLSATYSETNFTSLDGVERPGSYDSRVIGNLSIGWRPNDSWEFSGKFRFSTGTPTTPYNSDGTLDFTRFNEGDRLPVNHQLDIRVDKKWLFEKSMLNTYIDIQNVYNQSNIFSRRFDYEQGIAVDNESIGILPSIGVLFEF